jgi:hypothetical protein
MSDNVAHALAGAGGGILSMIVTYPLITVSTRAQVNRTVGDKATQVGFDLHTYIYTYIIYSKLTNSDGYIAELVNIEGFARDYY